jgi:hypothetical protein
MRFRNQIFGILSFVFAGLLLSIFKETSWAIFVERFLEEAAHSLGIERAAMIATLSQILLGGGILWAALHFAFRVGKAERPDPAVEAQRQHTAAILAQTEALKIGPPALAGVEEPKNVAFDPSWARDVELWETLWRAYSGNWNGRIDVETGVEILRFEIAADAIRQHAFEGALPIWGRRPNSNLYELIPRGFWRNHEIVATYMLSSTGRDVWVCITHALAVGDVPHARAREWEGYMTCKEAVEKLWPEGS